MAGTLFGLGLSQQYDSTGAPAAGALLYIYEANTSTPANTFADFGLSVSQTFPIVADGNGRLPQLWVADGSYRARLTTSTGVVIFDEESVTAIGASVTSGGGSGGGGGVDATTVFQTGDTLWVPIVGTRTGWVRANGRTIGSAASGASERANSDTMALFEYLWNADSFLTVSTGRGASASSDFASNKTIVLFDLRGSVAAGLDDMGNSLAGIITGGFPSSAGSTGGAEMSTINQINIPAYNLDLSSVTASTPTATISGSNHLEVGGATNLPGGTGSNTYSQVSLPITVGSITVGGTLASGGSSTALTTISPYMLGTWYLKL